MIDCAYVGDSIAVGLHQLEPKCAVHARVGAGSEFITRHYSNVAAEDHVVISIGSNDPYNPLLLSNAEKLRKSIHAKTVIWILPYNRVAAGDIELVAREFGDRVVDLKPIPSRDGVHPAYKPAHKLVAEKF